jgi:hypothetical protein
MRGNGPEEQGSTGSGIVIPQRPLRSTVAHILVVNACSRVVRLYAVYEGEGANTGW